MDVYCSLSSGKPCFVMPGLNLLDNCRVCVCNPTSLPLHQATKYTLQQAVKPRWKDGIVGEILNWDSRGLASSLGSSKDLFGKQVSPLLCSSPASVMEGYYDSSPRCWGMVRINSLMFVRLIWSHERGHASTYFTDSSTASWPNSTQCAVTLYATRLHHVIWMGVCSQRGKIAEACVIVCLSCQHIFFM